MRRSLLSGLMVAAVALLLAPAAEAKKPPSGDGGGSGAVAADPYRSLQWGLDQVHAPQAWSASTGTGAVIAVVDSGVDLDHPDLQGQLVAGATFVCRGGEPRPCGNGDWQSGADNGNGHFHGTHVAGIAAAATNNGIGVAGVAPGARIMPVKALDAEGSGAFEDIADGIRWAVDHGADVVNLSLGALPGVQAFVITGLETAVAEAIQYAVSRGVVVVAAAGNESSPLCDTPAFDSGALCVVATDRLEARPWYSNFGINPELHAVSAPGGQGLVSCEEDVLSTVPLGTESSCTAGTRPGYDFLAGTSMATPHVAGVAALLVAQGRDNVETVDVLEATARQPVTGLRGTYTPAYGFGIVDAAAAVAAP